VPYDKPEGKQQVLAVPGKAEKPRFMVPEHDLRKRHFFWTDMDTMEKVSGIEEGDGVLLVQVRSDNEDESVHFPAQPPLLSVGEYKTTPLIHAGYAATWFGLAGAGIYMTRKLITRGRV
jgi:cytochrome oxidase assembly protein ShyY1